MHLLLTFVSRKVESPRKPDSPRKSDAIKPRTHLVKCSGCEGEMQIVIIDGKIYHASCSPITTPPKPSPILPPSYTSAALAVVSRNPSTSLASPSTAVSDTIYAPLPSLPRHSEPGVQSSKANTQEGTSMSAPLAPNPLRSAILPSQDELLRAISEESKDKEKDRDLRESKEKDPSDKGHKRQPSWTHASPSVRISSRAGQVSRDSGSNLSPVPKPPPPVAPAPTPSPDMLLQPILPASAASASPLSSTSSSTSVSASSSRSGSTRSQANIGSARPMSPPPSPSSSSSTPTTSTIVFPTIPPPATPPPGADVFSDDPDAAEIERLAELIEEGRFSDVEAYLLLLDQPQQVEARARKLSIVLARKLSESGPPGAKQRAKD